MPLDVSKECFPSPTKCHNCLRKRSNEVRKERNPAEEFKRCGNCHITTYCDKDCQREHWTKVHRNHCRFLSGKVLADGAKHNAATCARCIAQNQASPAQLRSENSPRSVCNIEEVIVAMKAGLGTAFGFHGDGKKCSCELQFAFELPFPVGEVSGEYLEIASTGLDAMMAHALSILTAMIIKAKKEDHKNILKQLWKNIVSERSLLWYYILEGGMPLIGSTELEVLTDLVDSLLTFYGASNPWWKTLRFSVHFVMKTNENLNSNFNASHGLEHPKFQTLKLILDYQHSQIEKQAIVSRKKMWSTFMLWPALVNGSLAMILPSGTRCQNCYSQLIGQVAISPAEVNFKCLSNVIVDVGDNGALMASCPASKNPNCWRNCLFKNVVFRVRSDEDRWKESLKENDIFTIESRECDFCLKSSLSSHRCSACRTVQYCSTVCQKKDLDFHKTVCETWAKDKSRRILGKEKQKEHWKSVFRKK